MGHRAPQHCAVFVCGTEEYRMALVLLYEISISFVEVFDCERSYGASASQMAYGCGLCATIWTYIIIATHVVGSLSQSSGGLSMACVANILKFNNHNITQMQ